MDVVDEGFDGVLIFCGVIWNVLSEDGVFDISYVSLEDWFLHGVGVPVLGFVSCLAIAGPSFLINLVFVTHGDVLDIHSFFVIILK